VAEIARAQHQNLYPLILSYLPSGSPIIMWPLCITIVHALNRVLLHLLLKNLCKPCQTTDFLLLARVPISATFFSSEEPVSNDGENSLGVLFPRTLIDWSMGLASRYWFQQP
jgi:hypothetical protein